MHRIVFFFFKFRHDCEQISMRGIFLVAKDRRVIARSHLIRRKCELNLNLKFPLTYVLRGFLRGRGAVFLANRLCPR